MDHLYEAVSNLIVTLSNFVWGWPDQLPLIVVLLVGTGIITTFRLGWIQIRYFRHGIRVVRGEYDDPEHEGDLSHFQALTTALSATVGIGNIAGVATAIHYGGPGALFWMWVTAVFGMALKYTECTLAMKFRTILPDGSAAGGPMYSIEKGLGKAWKPLAVAFAGFAVISSFGSGNAVQSFTVADQFRQDLGVPTWITGAVMASLVALVILGGIRRIGRVTSKLVPFMAVLYVGSAMVVLALNLGEVPSTLLLIFQLGVRTGGPDRRFCRRRLHLHAHLGGQTRALLQRVGSGLGAHRPRRRQDRRAHPRRRRGHARPLHRHPDHLHHDRARHPDLRSRGTTNRSNRSWSTTRRPSSWSSTGPPLNSTVSFARLGSGLGTARGHPRTRLEASI